MLPSRHRVAVLPAHLPSLDATAADSAVALAHHTHDRFGIGLVARGAQRSASGRGPVEAGPGDMITVNPGEVHDGASRAWRMLYLDPALLRAAAAEAGLDSPGLVKLRRRRSPGAAAERHEEGGADTAVHGGSPRRRRHPHTARWRLDAYRGPKRHPPRQRVSGPARWREPRRAPLRAPAVLPMRVAELARGCHACRPP